jgi:hypothetical protein
VDRWPSPHALLGLAGLSIENSADLRGTSRPNSPWGRVDQWPGPHDLRFSFEDSVRLAPSSRPPPSACSLVRRPRARWGLRRGLLSWGCQSSPLRRHPCRSSTPDRVAAPRSRLQAGSGDPAVRRDVAIGPELPPSGLVPPLPFLPASTVYSALHVSGLLHPETDHGVRHVSGVRVRFGFLTRPRPARAGSGRAPAPTPPGGCFPGRAPRQSRRTPKSNEGLAEVPGGTFGLPWPSPVALYPSELSPSRQLCRVNRFVWPRPADLSTSGDRMWSCLWGVVGCRSRATAVDAFSPLWSCWCHRSVSSRKRVDSSWLASLAHSASRPWSTVKSVATRSRCRSLVARCSLGLRLVRICRRLAVAVAVRVSGCRSIPSPAAEALGADRPWFASPPTEPEPVPPACWWMKRFLTSPACHLPAVLSVPKLRGSR